MVAGHRFESPLSSPRAGAFTAPMILPMEMYRVPLRSVPVQATTPAEIRGVGIKFGERLDPATGGITVYVKSLVQDGPAHLCGLILPGDILVRCSLVQLLQRVAVCCCSAISWSVCVCIMCGSVHACNVLWCAVVCCSMLQCVAVYCSTLRCIAVRCSVLQYVAFVVCRSLDACTLSTTAWF